MLLGWFKDLESDNMLDMRDLNQEEIYKILKGLNGGQVEGSWKMVQESAVMPSAKIEPDGGVGANLGEILVLKVFINTDTGEIKSFLIKHLTNE